MTVILRVGIRTRSPSCGIVSRREEGAVLAYGIHESGYRKVIALDVGGSPPAL
jgi:hypothetical protein